MMGDIEGENEWSNEMSGLNWNGNWFPIGPLRIDGLGFTNFLLSLMMARKRSNYSKGVKYLELGLVGLSESLKFRRTKHTHSEVRFSFWNCSPTRQRGF